MLDDTKIKLRELFEKVKQEEELITEENGETIFHKYDLFDAIVWVNTFCSCCFYCDYNGDRSAVDINWPILTLVQDILELAFEFTKE